MRLATSIDRVTVFPHGAEVVRVGAIELTEGEHRLIVDDLPALADQASLRVEGMADGPLEIGDVDSESVFVGRNERGGEDERRRLEAEIEALSDRQRQSDGRRAVLEAQKALMQNLAQSPVHPSPDQMTEIDWAARFDLIGERLAAVYVALDRQTIERRDIDRLLDEARRKLLDLGNEGERRLAATITVRAAKALSGRLELRYHVPYAGWAPLYDARLVTAAASGEAELQLVRRAAVHQATGEDWRDVVMRLSTARISGATAAPDLHSEWLDIEQAVLAAGPPLVAAKAMYRMDAAAAAPDAQPEHGFAAEAEAQIEVAGFEAVFEVPGRVDMPRGLGSKKLRLATLQRPVRLEVRATPLLDPTAYLHAALTLDDATALLPGHVALYRDGVYVGEGHLPLVNVGETHELGFGGLDQVQVRRIEEKVSKGRHGIIKSENTDERHYRLKVTNRHTARLPVRIFERIPVARHDRIKVEILSDTSRFAEEHVEDRRGVVAFLAEIKPGGDAEFDLHYRISWPKDEHIVYG